jgi:hypothetical protein
MRKILLALLALPVLTYGQFRIVGNASFVTVNDSTYTASITAKPDLTGFGYNAFNIEVGDVVFTAIENAYKIDSVWGKTRTTANIRVQDYNILGDSMTNQTYGKPMGQFVVARLNPNRTIPQAPIAVLAASPQLNAAIDAHNAKVAVTVVSQLVDSTRLNATGDTLYYYQNDSLIGVAAIKAGLWNISLIDSGTIYYNDNVAIGSDTSYGAKLYVEGNRVHLNNKGNAGAFYLSNDSTGVGGNNGLYMYLANRDGNLVLFENARLNLGVNNSLKFTLNDTAVGIFTNFPEFPLEIASTKGIIIPNGTTAERPTYVADGLLRYNEDSSRFEYYSTATTNWIQITDTSGYNFSLSLGLDSVLTITDGNSTLTANLAATFDNTDTSGYNILLAYTNDTLFITDGNSTLSVEIPTIVDSTRLNTIGDTLYYYQDGTLIGTAAIKAGLWNQSLRDVGTIYYDDVVAIGTDSAFGDVDLVVYDSSGIGLLQIVSGNVTSYLRLTDGLDSWDIRNVQGSGDVFRISRSTAGDGQRGFLIDTLNRVGINVSTIDLINSDADLYIDRTSGVLISRGTTLQRPTTTDNGLLRFNTDSTRYEYWDNGISSWIQIMDTSGYNSSLTFANDTLYLVDGNSELKVELPQVADTDDQTLSIVGKDSIAISEGNQVRLPIYYNVDEGTYQAEINGTKILLLGQENLYRVKNQTGSAIPAGTVVGFAGTLGASGIILVSPFNANGSLPARYVVGVTPLEIPNDSLGYVTDFGKIRGIKTDENAAATESWVNGDILWADPNNIGGLTKTEPQAPNLKLPIAAVVYAAATNGELLVRVETGESLFDDNDVQIDTANITDNQFLVWDDGQQRWENGYVKVDSITVFGEGTTADPLYVDTFKLVTIDYLNTLLDTSITVTSADTVRRKIENNLIGKGVEANWFNIDAETDNCNLDYIDFYVYQRSNTIDLGPYQFKLYYSNVVTHPDSNMLITTFDAYNDSTVRVDLGDFTLTRPTVLYLETPFVGGMKLFNTLIADYTFVCNTGVTNPVVFTGGEARDTIVASGFIVAGAFRVSTDQTSTISTQDSLKIGASNVSISEVPSEALDVIGKMRLAVNESVGDFSVYIGNLAGKTNNGAASNNNVGVGWRALEDFSSGAGNTAIGAATLANLTTGSFNTALGWLAGLDLEGGSNNILIGTRMPFAGVLTDAYKSIYIGDSIIASSTTPIEEIVIGSKITGAGNNTITIGNSSNKKLKSNKYIFNVDQDTTGLNGYLLTYNGTSGEIELQAAPASSPWSESGNYIYTTTDSVGIGTSSPIAALDVRGRIDLFSPSSSTYVGRYAGNDMVSTNQKFNVGIGIGSMRYDTIGKYNTAVGGFTLQYYNGIENAYNTAIGYGVLDAVGLTGVWNTGVGANSLGATTTGQANTVLGFNSLASNTTGSNNTVVGAQSYAGNSGGNNTIVGYGIDNGGTGSNNIAIGYDADLLGASATNQIVIGADIQSAGDSIALIGNAMKQLRVNKYILNTDQDTTGLDGYVLTYDAATSEITLKESSVGLASVESDGVTILGDGTTGDKLRVDTTIVSSIKGLNDSLATKLNTSFSNVTGTLPVANGGTGVSSLTANKVLVGNGTDTVLTPTNLHWDNTNSRLGIGITAPRVALEVNADQIIDASNVWTARTSAADNQWFSVTYGNGLFVAVAQSGTGNRVMTSPDGITWTARTSAADNQWYSVTYGNGLFVAVAVSGTGNRVMTSPDGITWTARTSAADNEWRSVTYGNGLFVAVAVSGTGNRVMTSPDGITWTARTSAADNQWRSVTYGNGLFVAVAFTGTGNRVMTSPDGITWTARTSAADNQWFSVTYGNGLFVAVANSGTGNRVMTSPDGITWTARTSAADNEWLGVTYGNGLFVAVARTGSGNRVMTSPDGITWTARTSAADNDWFGVTYGNGLFVAVAFTGTGNRVMTSGKQYKQDLAHNNIWQGNQYMPYVYNQTTAEAANMYIDTTTGELKRSTFSLQDSLNSKLDTSALSPLTLYQQVFVANGTDSTYTFTETSLPDSIANIIVLQNGLTIDKAYISITAPNIVRLSYLPLNNDRIVIIVFKGTGILGGGGGGISSVVTDGVTILGDGTSGSVLRADTTNYIATKGDLNGYVTTTTTQSISGEKTFANDNVIMTSGSAGGFPKLTINNTTTGSNLANYFPSLEFKSISDQNAGVKDTIARIVALGSGNGSTYPQSASIEFLGTTLTSDRVGADILFKTNFTTSGSNSVNTERMRITSTGEVFIGTTTDNGNYKLQVDGPAYIDGGAVSGSDKSIKENIYPIYNGLNMVQKLRPVEYNYIESRSSDQSKQLGFIAQEVQDALGKYADGVVKDYGLTLGMKYDNLIPVLTKAIQEQQEIIEQLKARIEALENK